jgi:hypothetical protein
MKKVPILVSLVIASSLLVGCDTRRRYDIDKDLSNFKIPFANSQAEALVKCEAEVKKELAKDREMLEEFGYARYHSDKWALKEMLTTECRESPLSVEDGNTWVSPKRGLDLGEVCIVSTDAIDMMRVQRLIPDETSVDDPDWNKPTLEFGIKKLAFYPCSQS